MKKNRIFGIALLALLSLCTASAAVNISTNKTKTIETGVSAETDSYSSISDSLQGNDLRTALNTLNNSKRKKTVGYAGMRTFAAVCDADPDGSGKIIGFYDNKKVGPAWDSAATWNREHVWPNVRGGSAVEDDAHMTRPASTQTNSDRGSKGYGTESYDPGQFVPYYRGAASRIIFYAAIASLNLNLVDDPLNYNGGSPANSMGSLSEMLEWNLQYLPQDTSFTDDNDLARRTELNRNEKIQNASGGQGNRNPFIDHPEYACKIWGNTNDKTRAICKGHYDPPSGGDDTPSTPDTPDTPVANPTTSKNYKLGTYQQTLSKQYYATGKSLSDSFGEYVQGKENGADVNLISSNDGYQIKMTKKDGNVVYLNGLLNSGSTACLSFDSSPTTEWTFNSTYNTFQTTINSAVYFLSTLSNQTYYKLSPISLINGGKVNHAHLYAIDGQEDNPTPDDGSGSSDSGDTKPKGGGGCHASIEGNSSIVFISSTILLFFAIKQAIKARKRKENN